MEGKKEIVFKEYEQIYNHYSPDGVSVIKKFLDNPDLKDQIWVSTEKIHGCNFSFVTNGTDVRCGKRNSILKEKEAFNNYQIILAKYQTKIIQLYNVMKKDNPQIDIVRVYGQFYGGIYDGIKDGKVKAIFTEVKYSPDLEFEAFDISIQYEKEEKEFYLNYDKVVDYLKKLAIPYAEIVAKGKLQEVLDAVDVDKMESTIYQKIRGGTLEKIPENYAEGLVVQTVDNLIDPETNLRYVLKVKSKRFGEVRSAPKEQKKKEEQKEEKKDLNPEVSALVDLAGTFINKNRLDSVLSKLSDHEKNEKTISGKLMQDAWKDYEAEFQTEDKKAQKQLINSNKKYIMEKFKDEITNLLKLYPPESPATTTE